MGNDGEVPRQHDSVYYEVAGRRTIGERLTVLARDRIYADFMRLMRPEPTWRILDVGVSDVINDAANVLERRYPFPNFITAAGLGSGAAFRAAYPTITYCQVKANSSLPFADSTFEIGTSNAVLEHVGSQTHQILHLKELLRVARRVFLTVPNRFFPIEHHTAIPILHFHDRTFRAACSVLAKNYWAKEENLILMTRASLSRLIRGGVRATVGYTGIMLGPFSSNLYLLAEHPR